MPTFYNPLGPSMSSAKRHPEQTPIVIHNELSGRERTRRELSASGLENPFSTLAAKSRDNRGKNRYTDIAPYDRTRAKVQEKEGAEGYLNASWVEEVDGERRWVASQAPLPSTLPSFYTFLLTSPSLGLVVQLTNFIERGIQKAEPYLPTASSPVMKFPGAEGLEVKWLRTEKRPQEGCEVTDLEISSEGGKMKKVVKHLWFQGWPDKGVPSDVGLLMKFMKLVEETNVSFQPPSLPTSSSSSSPPILVHCSAGVGRTGSFISISSLLRLLPLHRSNFPTPSQSSLGPLSKDVRNDPLAIVIDHCREQRLMMVETKEQVDLVWRCTREAAEGRKSS
ncbi:protein-tyrosine phosphatase-like protein [Mrakia frigida]|uniref:protein tyrosine phosphatase family protein n=1 Tax=Mrakia frigida TaxID=29902 RepID=UPI003FCBEF51